MYTPPTTTPTCAGDVDPVGGAAFWRREVARVAVHVHVHAEAVVVVTLDAPDRLSVRGFTRDHVDQVLTPPTARSTPLQHMQTANGWMDERMNAWIFKWIILMLQLSSEMVINLSSGGAGSFAHQGPIYMGAAIGVLVAPPPPPPRLSDYWFCFCFFVVAEMVTFCL